MSVDFDLRQQTGAHLDPFEYMAARAHLFDVDGRRATYAQPDTGVTAELVGTTDGLRATLAVLRPSYWGTEFSEQAERLAAACSLTYDGSDVGAARVHDVWAHANEAAWRLDRSADRPVLPDDVVDRWWAWNRRLLDLRPLYPDAHVGQARICSIDGSWRLCSVWTDLGDAVLPPVDAVLVLSAGLTGAGVAAGLIPIDAAELDALGVGPGPDGTLVVGARSGSPVLDALRGRPAIPGTLETVHPADGIERRFANVV